MDCVLISEMGRTYFQRVLDKDALDISNKKQHWRPFKKKKGSGTVLL